MFLVSMTHLVWIKRRFCMYFMSIASLFTAQHHATNIFIGGVTSKWSSLWSYRSTKHSQEVFKVVFELFWLGWHVANYMWKIFELYVKFIFSTKTGTVLNSIKIKNMVKWPHRFKIWDQNLLFLKSYSVVEKWKNSTFMQHILIFEPWCSRMWR